MSVTLSAPAYVSVRGMVMCRPVLATLFAQDSLVGAALSVGMGVVTSAVGLSSPTAAIAPERGGRVSELRHLRLAGRSHGPYRGRVSDRQCLLYANTADVGAAACPAFGAVAPPRPAQQWFRR